MKHTTLRRARALGAAVTLALAAGCGGDSSHDRPAPKGPPNILFIVVDDVGVDQFEVFGYGGTPAPQTRSIDAIARAGVRFRNTWSMPTCSPTRSTYFLGQYPFRSGVRNAVVTTDLANSQVSPYALTIPRLLREEAGYVSALIGKMHLTGSDLNPVNHPLGDSAMRLLGWDYFAGYLDGAPWPVDTTGGGVAPEGTYQCGFVPTTAVDPVHGADIGVCYFPDGSHQVMDDPARWPTPGRTCVEQGGILDPGTTAWSAARHDELRFENQNGHYTGEWKVNHEDGRNETIPPGDPRARGYRATLETDRAIEWINATRRERKGTPWMLTLGYSSLHAPLQPPPAALLPHPDATLSLIGCGSLVTDRLAELGVPVAGDIADFAQQRAVAQHMLEAVDHEIGRLLVETGIARRDRDGNLRYDPASNTVVIFASDNGTYMPSVKLPFDFTRAKGTLYQTGVWVPLIVAGPMVAETDRDVPHMVNTTDLYSLFRELAGIGTDRLPAGRPLDAQPVLPYLTDPDQPAIRSTNFTEQGTNISAEIAPPCVIPAANTCVQIFPQKQVCEDQSGIWYGPGGEHGSFDSCCAVNAHLVSEGADPVDIFPHAQRALRNATHKLVRITRLDCATDALVDSEELYVINESTDPATLKLDRADDDLLAAGEEGLTPEDAAQLLALRQELDALLASDVSCDGDGNGDLVVDQTDLDEWAYWSDPARGGGTSWYDFDHDGDTDEDDKVVIKMNMGTDCRL